MTDRPKDYAFEALAETTATDMNGGRGELNMALKLIREQSPEVADDSFMLAELIRARAKMYRLVMPEVMLTPTALAKHWQRVFEETESRKTRGGTNQAATTSDECRTCGGDRFVLVGTRPAVQSPWAAERGIKHPEGTSTEEYAACPDCNPTDTSFFRADGSKVRALDPQKVRELMAR